MKNLKNFKMFKINESNNSDLEKKLEEVIILIKKGHHVKKITKDLTSEFVIDFIEIENKLNKKVFAFDEVNISNIELVVIDEHNLFDIQLTYDIRGIVLMTGFEDKPLVLKTFSIDIDNDVIKDEVVELVISNIFKYSKEKKKPSYRDIGGTGCLRCAGEGCIKCVKDYGRPWHDKILNPGNNWLSRNLDQN